MDTEIAALEQQLEQLIALLDSGKAEARALRARVGALEAENQVLSEKVSRAADKLESLLEKIPEA